MYIDYTLVEDRWKIRVIEYKVSQFLEEEEGGSSDHSSSCPRRRVFLRQVWLPRSVGGCQRLVRKRWTSHGWKAIRTRGVSCIPCTSRSSFALPSSLLLSALCKSGRLEGVVRFDRALTARVALAINCESFLFSFLFFSKVADLGNSERARNTYFQQFPPSRS